MCSTTCTFVLLYLFLLLLRVDHSYSLYDRFEFLRTLIHRPAIIRNKNNGNEQFKQFNYSIIQLFNYQYVK